MPDLTTDTTASDIIADLVATLGAVTTGGVKAFASVEVIADEASFLNWDNPLQSGASAAIIDARPTEGPGTCDVDDHFNLLSTHVAIGVYQKTGMDSDISALATACRQLAELAREAIVQDRTRGGRCKVVPWQGRLVRCTEVFGEPKPMRVPAKARTLFYGVLVPVQCAWITPAS